MSKSINDFEESNSNLEIVEPVKVLIGFSRLL